MIDVTLGTKMVGSVTIKICLYINLSSHNSFVDITAWEVFKYGVFSGPYFPAFGLNTERKNSVSGHFSRSASIVSFVELEMSRNFFVDLVVDEQQCN